MKLLLSVPCAYLRKHYLLDFRNFDSHKNKEPYWDRIFQNPTSILQLWFLFNQRYITFLKKVASWNFEISNIILIFKNDLKIYIVANRKMKKMPMCLDDLLDTHDNSSS